MPKINLDQIISDLANAGAIAGDGLGEYWKLLAQFEPMASDHTGNTDLVLALRKELRFQHKRLKEEFQIVEESITRTTVVKRLVHHSELT